MEKKPELIENKYYWVKRFKDRYYEPAKCSDRYDNEDLFFEFTGGDILHCGLTYDYKELINPFNT